MSKISKKFLASIELPRKITLMLLAVFRGIVRISSWGTQEKPKGGGVDLFSELDSLAIFLEWGGAMGEWRRVGPTSGYASGYTKYIYIYYIYI